MQRRQDNGGFCEDPLASLCSRSGTDPKPCQHLQVVIGNGRDWACIVAYFLLISIVLKGG